jgi:S-adenosylmethionine/arginine decarboxylase-like enzyme
MDNNNFGSLLIYDLKDIESIKSKNKDELYQLLHIIVEEIMDMNIIGEPTFEYFQDNEYNHSRGLTGFSATCIISLSSITLHICDIQKTAYIDIFTCCKIDEDITFNISKTLKRFFEPSQIRTKIIHRGVGWN